MQYSIRYVVIPHFLTLLRLDTLCLVAPYPFRLEPLEALGSFIIREVTRSIHTVTDCPYPSVLVLGALHRLAHWQLIFAQDSMAADWKWSDDTRCHEQGHVISQLPIGPVMSTGPVQSRAVIISITSEQLRLECQPGSYF